MAQFTTHTGSLARYTEASGTLGERVRTIVTGYPRTVLGEFQWESADRVTTRRGVVIPIDAVFFTMDNGFQQEDQLTVDGVTYIVAHVKPWKERGHVSHYEIELVKT